MKKSEDPFINKDSFDCQDTIYDLGVSVAAMVGEQTQQRIKFSCQYSVC